MKLADELNRLLFQYQNAERDLDTFIYLSESKIDDVDKFLADQLAKLQPQQGQGNMLMVRPWAGIPMDEIIKDLDEYNRQFRTRFPALVFRMAFIYLVAQFDAFLSDVFELVIASRPEILRSKKAQVSYEDILDFITMEELIRYLAKRELHQLGYKSIRDQAKYYSDRFNIDLVDSGIELDVLATIRADRNILVHNNGVINHIYLEDVPKSPFKAGDTLPVSSQSWKDAAKCLNAVVDHVTKQLIQKFDR